MDEEFLMLCNSLNAAVIEPMMRPENQEDTLRDFGTLGQDIIRRWHIHLKNIN